MTQVGMRLALSLGMMKKTALLLLILTTFFTGCRNSPEVIEEECTQPSCLGSSATLEPPTGLSISGISETSATVTWTDPNFQGSFIIDVSFKKATVQTFTNFGTVDKGVQSIALTNLIAATNYEVRLRALGTAGATDHTSVVSFATLSEDGETPPPPTVNPLPQNASASVAGVNKTINWTWSNTDYGLLSSVHVHRKPEGANDSAFVSIFSQNIGIGVVPVTTYTDGQAVTGSVVYRVVALYDDSTSTPSNTTNAVADGNLPTPTLTTVQVWSSFNDEHRVNWNSYSQSNHLGFEVRYSVDGGATYTIAPGTSGPTTTYKIVEPLGCTNYVTYQLRAISNIGPTYNSGWSNQLTQTCP